MDFFRFFFGMIDFHLQIISRSWGATERDEKRKKHRPILILPSELPGQNQQHSLYSSNIELISDWTFPIFHLNSRTKNPFKSILQNEYLPYLHFTIKHEFNSFFLEYRTDRIHGSLGLQHLYAQKM